MNIFSKLFSTAQTTNNSYDNALQRIKDIFKDSGEFYTDLFLSCHKEKKTIKYILLHPSAGVVLFNFFDFTARELKGVTASKADASENADIKTRDDKTCIQLRFDEIYHYQVAPVRSILICPNLSEKEFNSLDKSFHELIPKGVTLFSDSNRATYENIILGKQSVTYDVDKIKQALLSELIVAESNSLMTKEQQIAVHASLENNILVKGLPGSGKSSVLVAKALYEKMKDPDIRLVFFAKQSCSIHKLQSIIFKFVENTHWGFNPAEIEVSGFEYITRKSRNREKYDLIICDDVNISDIPNLKTMMHKNSKLLISSCYDIKDFDTYTLHNSFRLNDSVSAACEGLLTEKLDEFISFQSGNVFMNTILILEELLKDTKTNEISIAHYSKRESLLLQAEINECFGEISYMYDDIEKKDQLIIYPLNQVSCLNNKYIIIIIDENSDYDPIELISRANQKSFILSSSDDVYQIIDKIKGNINESN